MKKFVEKLIGKLKESAQVTKDAVEIVNEVAAEYNNGWTLCTEKLPDAGVTVLCYWSRYDRDDNTTCYFYTLMERNEAGEWLSDFGRCNGKVIAWQLFPEPPYNEA